MPTIIGLSSDSMYRLIDVDVDADVDDELMVIILLTLIYTLGVYTLGRQQHFGLPILDLKTYILGGLHSGWLQNLGLPILI